MPKCTRSELPFGRLGRRVIQANFQGGALSSDGGLMLLRQVDQRIGLSAQVADALHDPRDPDRITHSLRDLIAQRLYALACGYEDLNDHARLRDDPLLQIAVGTTSALGSAPTLSRLETRVTRADIVALNGVLVEQFIASHEHVPQELILDVDASDIPLHGDQQQALRNSRIDGARHCAAVIKLLVRRLRQQWPQLRIIVRGDSGFCRQRLIRWCERNDVGYVIGMARNACLHRIVAPLEAELAQHYQQTQQKQRAIHEFSYAAKSWDKQRRLVTRLEYGAQGNNPRFVVSNLDLPAIELYDRLYCLRGEAENRIKETQLDLFGTRASCHRFLSNWLRVMLAGLAYSLMQRLKQLALVGTELARASSSTIRVRLLKIGAAVISNTRRIRILFASNHPLRELFASAAHALGP
jgi:hypothetical protein